MLFADKPVFNGDPSATSAPLQVEEGHKAIINMTASANPNNISYKWTREILEDAKKPVTGSGQMWTKSEIKQVKQN